MIKYKKIKEDQAYFLIEIILNQGKKFKKILQISVIIQTKLLSKV